MENMSIDFVSILRTSKREAYSLSTYPCTNIRNKITRGKQVSTLSTVIVFAITFCVLSLFLTSLIVAPSVSADSSNINSLMLTNKGLL